MVVHEEIAASQSNLSFYSDFSAPASYADIMLGLVGKQAGIHLPSLGKCPRSRADHAVDFQCFAGNGSRIIECFCFLPGFSPYFFL